MFQPWSDNHEKWKAFTERLVPLGATELDHGPYGGIYYHADTAEIGETISEAIKSILT